MHCINALTAPKDRLWLNKWTFYLSDEVFIIAWNISISKRNAEGLEPSNWSMEAQSAESRSEKQLHLSDILNSDYILCERCGLQMVINYECDRGKYQMLMQFKLLYDLMKCHFNDLTPQDEMQANEY